MKFDLHIHSKYSYDSLLSPEAIIRVARRKGLNGVGVTDHGTIKGGLATREINDADNFTVIIGTEIETDFGDILGLFLSREVRSRKFLEVCAEIRAQGGLVILAHPYRKGKVLNEDLLAYVDFIEGFNARSPRSLNLRSQELATAHKMPMVAGSDAHLPFEIGRGLTLLNGGIEALSNQRETVSMAGKESNYYLAHGLSMVIEQIKKRAKT